MLVGDLCSEIILRLIRKPHQDYLAPQRPPPKYQIDPRNNSHVCEHLQVDADCSTDPDFSVEYCGELLQCSL